MENLILDKEYELTYVGMNGNTTKKLFFTGYREMDGIEYLVFSGLYLTKDKILQINEPIKQKKEYIESGNYKKCRKCGGTGKVPLGNGICWSCKDGYIPILIKNPDYKI